MADRKRTAWIVQIIGGVLVVVGGLLAGLGTTEVGLFVFYLVLLFGGLALLGWGRHLYNQTLKG